MRPPATVIASAEVAVPSGRPAGPRDRLLAPLVATGCAVVVVFEVCLAAGAPWGSAAFGGADPGRLSTELRTASVLAAGFWSLAALTALVRGGVVASPTSSDLARRAAWGLTILLAAGTVMNAASSSAWERYGWAPFTLGLTVLSWRLARSQLVVVMSPQPTRAGA